MFALVPYVIALFTLVQLQVLLAESGPPGAPGSPPPVPVAAGGAGSHPRTAGDNGLVDSVICADEGEVCPCDTKVKAVGGIAPGWHDTSNSHQILCDPKQFGDVPGTIGQSSPVLEFTVNNQHNAKGKFQITLHKAWAPNGVRRVLELVQSGFLRQLQT